MIIRYFRLGYYNIGFERFTDFFLYLTCNAFSFLIAMYFMVLQEHFVDVSLVSYKDSFIIY